MECRDCSPIQRLRAKAPDEMRKRIEQKQSLLDRFGLGATRRPLLEHKPPPKPSKRRKRLG